MLPNLVVCLFGALALRTREGTDHVCDGYCGRICAGRPRLRIEIAHRNMACIQSLFPQCAYQQFSRNRVGCRAQPETEDNGSRLYSHRPLPSPGQLFTVLPQNSARIVVIMNRQAVSSQPLGFTADGGYDGDQQVAYVELLIATYRPELVIEETEVECGHQDEIAIR